MADHAGEARDTGEHVGSIGEEAAKLLAALQGWAGDNGQADAARAAASRLHELGEHVTTGGEDCRWCPVCQVISAVRGTPPEVREHLAAAAGSLVKAVAGLLDTSVPDGARAHDSRAGGTDDEAVADDDPDDADERWKD